jgi:hypothetical protein
MKESNIFIIYETDREKKILNDFVTTVNKNGISITMEEMPSQPKMGVEWLMATAVVIYLAKPYFNSFLSEMGKDHYQLLKKGLLDLKDCFFGDNVAKRVLITSSSSPNKLKDKSGKYSLDFSIMAEANNGNRFKLLIPKEITNQEYTNTITSFLMFLEKYNNNEVKEIPNEFIFSKTILLSYNSELDKLEFINPFAKIK